MAQGRLQVFVDYYCFLPFQHSFIHFTSLNLWFIWYHDVCWCHPNCWKLFSSSSCYMFSLFSWGESLLLLPCIIPVNEAVISASLMKLVANEEEKKWDNINWLKQGWWRNEKERRNSSSLVLWTFPSTICRGEWHSVIFELWNVNFMNRWCVSTQMKYIADGFIQISMKMTTLCGKRHDGKIYVKYFVPYNQ